MNKEEYIISIDLGTTLIKCIIYNSKLERISSCSIKYVLDSNGKFIEFDAYDYWNRLRQDLKKLIDQSYINPKRVRALGLTGQAETLVILDKNGNPLRKAISWLDERSEKEVEELKEFFDEKTGSSITGQEKIVTTWTATKLLWLKKNEPETYKKIKKITLIKDYITFQFTGLFVSESSTQQFSYYLASYKNQYWKDMLDFLGIEIRQLPELIDPGINAGMLNQDNIKYFSFDNNVVLNIGSNDQFAGLVGVGNIKKGIICEATGTVLTIGSIVDKKYLGDEDTLNFPIHYKEMKGKYFNLLTCESGGVSLDWFKNNFMKDKDFSELNRIVNRIEKGSRGLIFLPYIVGTNSPEYDPHISGGFLNIRIFHDETYFARAVMEGLGFLIRKNLDFLEKNNIKSNSIISLGGGSKSSVWNKIKADITGRKIKVSTEDDPVGLGIAIFMALELKYFSRLEEAVAITVKIKEEYLPETDENYELNYRRFLEFYNCLKNVHHT